MFFCGKRRWASNCFLETHQEGRVTTSGDRLPVRGRESRDDWWEGLDNRRHCSFDLPTNSNSWEGGVMGIPKEGGLGSEDTEGAGGVNHGRATE